MSYTLVTFIYTLSQLIGYTFEKDSLVLSFCAILMAFILAIIVSIVFKSKHFHSILSKYFNKAPNEDIWNNILDFKLGSNLKVYPKYKNYYIVGHYKTHEEKGADSWFALSGFAKFDKTTNNTYLNDPSYIGDTSVLITFRLRDIEHIEIF